MTFQGDPFRTLGIAPGASLNEIRSAYRRLAKQYHPDFAGDRALPRFLAIQAAYEQLVDGEGRLRRAAGGGGRRGGGEGDGGGRGGDRPGGAGEAWRADPARARASRDAWRARRSGSGGTWGYRPGPSGGRTTGSTGPSGGRTTGSTGAAGSGSTGPTGPTGSAAGSPGGSTGPAGSPGPRGAGPDRTRRAHRTAKPGSTSYDEAAETPLDPEWDGGAWYGPTSGTYWTLNPREYADPRKHGPEYLARARRASAADPGPLAPGHGGAAAEAAGEARSGGAAEPVRDAADARAQPAEPDGPPAARRPGPTRTRPTPRTEGTAEAAWAWTGGGQTRTEGSGAAWSRRDWTFDARDDGAAWSPGPERRDPHRPPRPADGRPTADEATRRRAGDPAADGRTPAPADPSALPDVEALVRRLFPEHLLRLANGPDRRWRLVVALVAWPPLGYGLGGIVSAVTGCAQYAATCPAPVPILLLLAQPLLVLGLWALRRVAAVGASAALAGLAVAVPTGAILSVGALPRPAVEPVVLALVVGTAYAAALAGGAWRLRAMPPPGEGA